MLKTEWKALPSFDIAFFSQQGQTWQQSTIILNFFGLTIMKRNYAK